MARLTPLDEAIASCRAVLAAAETILTDAGLPLPANRYVSIQGGDWLVGRCDDCCSQLVVTPMTMAVPYNDPYAVQVGGTDTRSARQRLVNYDIVHSASVNQNVEATRLSLGDVTLPWDATANRNTHWAETAPIIGARWALVREMPAEVNRQLCARGIVCRTVFVASADPWVEGGCAGTKLTVQVQQ